MPTCHLVDSNETNISITVTNFGGGAILTQNWTFELPVDVTRWCGAILVLFDVACPGGVHWSVGGVLTFPAVTGFPGQYWAPNALGSVGGIGPETGGSTDWDLHPGDGLPAFDGFDLPYSNAISAKVAANAGGTIQIETQFDFATTT